MNSILFWLVTLIFFCFAWWRLREVLLLLPFFFPLYLIKTSLAGIPFTLIEIFVYTATVVFIVRKFFKKSSQEFSILHLLYKNQTLFFWITLIIIGSLLALISVQIDLKTSLGIIKGWVIMPTLLFALWSEVIRDSRNKLTLLQSYTASALLLSLWGLWQVVTHTYITLDARASGPFESANYLALYIGPAIVYSWIQLQSHITQVRNQARQTKTQPYPLQGSTIIWLSVGLIMSAALLFSKSYAAMMAVVGALACYFFWQWHHKSKKSQNKQKQNTKHLWYWIGGGIIGFLAVLFLIFIIDPGKWQAMFHFEQQNSSSVRIEVYTVALNLIKRNWFFGIGSGQFQSHYELEAGDILGHPPYEPTMLHPHNIIFATWLNLGLIGLIGFIGVIIIALNKAWRNQSSHPIVIVGAALLLEVLIHGLFDTPFFKNDLALLFWLIIAIIVIEVHNRQSHISLL